MSKRMKFATPSGFDSWRHHIKKRGFYLAFLFKQATMDYYVYILQSEKDGRFYIGQSDNLARRLLEHNSLKSHYTKKYTPWRLVHFTLLDSRSEAYKLEQKLKKMKSRVRTIRFINENPCVPGAANLDIYDVIDLGASTNE